MSRRAKEPTKNNSVQVRALVKRQVQAWEKRDFAIAADDWLPNGELFSPGGHVVRKDMQRAILDYFKNFTDLKVTVNEMFLSEDGTRLAIQWDWTVTRKKDRKRATTHDAILVHLVGGKIATWNEYFGRSGRALFSRLDRSTRQSSEGVKGHFWQPSP